ncbi:hypothetical protein KI387_006728, partial [Taxus chinensis]
MSIAITMEAIACRKQVSAVTLFLFCLLRRLANAQPGFLSIDCGAQGNLIDSETNITWVADDNFIDVGDKEKFTKSEGMGYEFYLQSYRVFPKPLNKSCYQLPVKSEVTHLLRLSFVAGILTGPNGFNYSVEAQDMLYMRNLMFNTGQRMLVRGMILVTSDDLVHICLIRTSELYDPFISAIELRSLRPGMYTMAKPGTLLENYIRWDLGAKTQTRYPQDPFDRLWEPRSYSSGMIVNSEEEISITRTGNFPPPVVMQTAMGLRSGEENVSLALGVSTTNTSLVIMYFAKLDTSETGYRHFNVGIGNTFSETSMQINLTASFSAVELAFPYSATKEVVLNLYEGSILNAVEFFGLVPTEHLTSSNDVETLNAVKSKFFLKSWTSDPCFPFPWEGIQCSESFNNTVKVSEINLSGRNLSGNVPPIFGQLTELVYMSLDNNALTGTLPNMSSLSKLERLHLQNNSFNGTVPQWLTKLPNLKELFIEYNNFSGVIPQQLLDNKLLTIKYGNNKYLCANKKSCLPSFNSTSSPSKRHILGLALGLTGGGATVTTILVDFSMVLVPKSSKSRVFTLEEMKTATENFRHTIGHGGFGHVYLGKLQEGKQIAVKVLSTFSKHGIAQFLNEIDLLSRITHKKLVSLLGYCNESKDLMLVYEYMPGGSLSDNLHDPAQPSKYPHLDWKTRLKIALDAAQGLEYLHVGCTTKIIHRDVKTANILLDSELNGKLADFGLSRMNINGETSQINTTIKGTPGYLDPKYYQTHILTEKSDVYSFGVVLLELICGRRPLDTNRSPEKILLIDW